MDAPPTVSFQFAFKDATVDVSCVGPGINGTFFIPRDARGVGDITFQSAPHLPAYSAPEEHDNEELFPDPELQLCGLEPTLVMNEGNEAIEERAGIGSGLWTNLATLATLWEEEGSEMTEQESGLDAGTRTPRATLGMDREGVNNEHDGGINLKLWNDWWVNFLDPEETSPAAEDYPNVLRASPVLDDGPLADLYYDFGQA